MSAVQSPLAANPTSLLSRILQLDALTCLAMGLLLVLAKAALEPLLGLPSTLLLVAGLLLFPCAALMWLTGHSARLATLLVWVVVLGNVAWVLASLLVAFVWFTPTTLGQIFLVVQALAVLGLAELEYVGLRRTLHLA